MCCRAKSGVLSAVCSVIASFECRVAEVAAEIFVVGDCAAGGARGGVRRALSVGVSGGGCVRAVDLACPGAGGGESVAALWGWIGWVLDVEFAFRVWDTRFEVGVLRVEGRWYSGGRHIDHCGTRLDCQSLDCYGFCLSHCGRR